MISVSGMFQYLPVVARRSEVPGRAVSCRVTWRFDLSGWRIQVACAIQPQALLAKLCRPHFDYAFSEIFYALYLPCCRIPVFV